MGKTASKIAQSTGNKVGRAADAFVNGAKAQNKAAEQGREKAVSVSMNALGDVMAEKHVESGMRSVSDAGESFIDWNLSVRDTVTKPLRNVPVLDSAIHATAETGDLIANATKGLLPGGMYDRAQKTRTEAKRFRDEVNAPSTSAASVLNANNQLVDAGKTAIRLNSMVYDSQWVSSKGDSAKNEMWSSLEPDQEPRMFTLKNGDTIDNVATIYWQDGVRYVAFRGSETAQNWLHNFNMFPTEVDGYQVHTGTYRQWNAMEDQIFDALRADTSFEGPTVFTGHSLGGMIAQVAALRYNQEGLGTSSLYTFGSPPVLNQNGADMLNAATDSIVMYQSESDIVPTLNSASYVKPIEPTMLDNPDDIIRRMNMSHTVKTFESGDVSDLVKTEIGFSNLTKVAELGQQFGEYKLYQHSPNNYASMYDFHNAAPFTRMLIIERSIDQFGATMAGILEQKLLQQGVAVAEAAGIHKALDGFQEVMDGVAGMMRSAAQEAGVPEEVIAHQEAIFQGYKAYTTAIEDVMEIGERVTEEQYFNAVTTRMVQVNGEMSAGLSEIMTSDIASTFAEQWGGEWLNLGKKTAAEATTMLAGGIRKSFTVLAETGSIVAEVVQPLLWIQLAQDVGEISLTLHYNKEADSIIQDTLTDLEQDQGVQRAISNVKNALMNDGVYALMMELASMDPSATVMFDPQNPTHVWKGTVADEGYLEWSSNLEADPELSSITEMIDLLISTTVQSNSIEVPDALQRDVGSSATLSLNIENAINGDNTKTQEDMEDEIWGQSQAEQDAAFDQVLDTPDDYADELVQDDRLVFVDPYKPTDEHAQPSEPGKFFVGKGIVLLGWAE